MPVAGANLIDEDRSLSGGAAATLFRSFTHCPLNNDDANWTSYKRRERATNRIARALAPQSTHGRGHWVDVVGCFVYVHC